MMTLSSGDDDSVGNEEPGLEGERSAKDDLTKNFFFAENDEL
jgi:hypothetical protein